MHNPIDIQNQVPIYTAKDFESDQEVRWCPGCGDYSILKSVQKILPQIGKSKEDTVFVSGIGCSSRFPYYIDTYGLHSIHGRAFSVATGLKISRPELDVWVITGDGDGLSIGGNHLIHTCRRNPNLNILLFNNEIYGLTKGQHSPTSSQGQVTKSSPLGNIDTPFNPLLLTLGAGASFVARTADRFPAHMQQTLLQAAKYKGCSFVEIYQNCNIFNDGAFETFTDKESKDQHSIFIEHGKPLRFGVSNEWSIVLKNMEPCIVATSEIQEGEEWIHNQENKNLALLIAQFAQNPLFPRPFGVLYSVERECYENLFAMTPKIVEEEKLDKLIEGKFNWIV
jgi:2-oxoglutarate ferredoxin oxidoreductase subunit beta